MLRNLDLSEYTDGKKYKSNDMVRISCDDCKGCSECCRDMGNTIVIDPYDARKLCSGLGKSFDKLFDEGYIELNDVDGIVLPNIKMNPETKACPFLNEEGRCSIHDFRPGFCRMFPLGRLYENGDFSYIYQIHECKYTNKSKVKIKNWLDIPKLADYEDFIRQWHDYLNEMRQKIQDEPEKKKDYYIEVLNYYYNQS